MTIAKADILTRVNERLQTAFTDIDTQIQEILDDLSEEDLLVGIDGGDFTITSIAGTDIVITGDATKRAAAGDTIRISGCTDDDNNTTWTISSMTYTSPSTTVVATAALDAATDGTLHFGHIISANDLSIDEPAGFRAMVSLSLNVNSTNSKREPLIKLPGGHRHYQYLRHNDTATAIPTYYSNFDGKFYLWRPASVELTSLIEYYKDHPQDVDNIEFGDNYRNVINAGATFKMALEKGRSRMIGLWGPMYQDAKLKRIDSMPRQPRIVRG